MRAPFPELGDPTYVLLTTFTSDGRPKPTPVWAAPDGAELLVITQVRSWKVRRIRNTGLVTLSACDVRGRPRGPEIPAQARILDPSRTTSVYAAIRRRYGLLGRVYSRLSIARGGLRDNVGIALTAPPG